VQSAEDVRIIRATLGPEGKDVKIISKIENQEGLNNFDEIAAECDAIMVARGDLGMEIPPEKVFIAQKIMTAKCNVIGKPVIVATQMLESMTGAPRPTRAEAGDVANAILDGADAVMLSGETAGGDFPVESVTIMRKLCEEAEASLNYQSVYSEIRAEVLAAPPAGRMETVDAMTSTVVKTAADAAAPLIVALTESGSTVMAIAKFRPKATILAVTSSEYTARSLNTVRGSIALIMPLEGDPDENCKKAVEYAKRVGVPGVVTGCPVVLVCEEREGSNGASVNAKVIKLRTAA